MLPKFFSCQRPAAKAISSDRGAEDEHTSFLKFLCTAYESSPETVFLKATQWLLTTTDMYQVVQENPHLPFDCH